MYKPTTLGFAILGLLFEPKSGYQVRKIFETTPLGEYSSSPGSIYPALKRLLGEGLITIITNSVNNKKQYKITDYGISIIKEWCLESPTLTDIQNNFNEVMLKFVLMENLTKSEDVQTFLISVRDNLTIYIKELDKYFKNDQSNLSLNSRLALEQGISMLKTNYAWVVNTLKDYF